MGFGKPGHHVTLSEINVTPFVDVMLVLLIIFMISAPLMQNGVQVDLPRATTGQMQDSPDRILLTVDEKHKFTLNGKGLARGTLTKHLQGIATAKPDAQVYLQADRSLSYGDIARIIAEVKRSGIHHIGLVTLPGDAASDPL